ncbi:MAG: LytR C-terminal domain-containing protein [Clostridia bacterium]|nr:LytR C-terminal domain-containing protein [Clostridia bacterium]
MNKKLYFSVIFYIIGSFILIFMGINVASNFARDARVFEKSIAKAEKDNSIKLPDKSSVSQGTSEKMVKIPESKDSVDSKNGNKATPKPMLIKVEVINYTGINKLAEEIRYTLEANGFQVSAGNGKSNKFVTTAIIERNDKKAGIEVQKVIKIGKIKKELTPGSRFDVTVILGDDYKP